MGGYDAVVFNTRRENVPDFGDWTLSAAEMEGLREYVSGGGGFVCIHIATCVAATRPEYHDITGGGWISGTSYHPPYGEFTVNVSDAGHPGVAGIADFSTNDELYMNLALKDGNNVFLTGAADDGTYPWGPDRSPTFMPGGTYPLGWTRKYGDGNVYVLLLGARRPELPDAGVPEVGAQRRGLGCCESGGLAGPGSPVWPGDRAARAANSRNSGCALTEHPEFFGQMDLRVAIRRGRRTPAGRGQWHGPARSPGRPAALSPTGWKPGCSVRCPGNGA